MPSQGSWKNIFKNKVAILNTWQVFNNIIIIQYEMMKAERKYTEVKPRKDRDISSNPVTLRPRYNH